MPIDVKNREYRTMAAVMGAVPQAEGAEERSYIVEGYATTYDDPYLLYDYGDWKTYESMAHGCIDADTEMSDVIMQYDHQGRVLARMSNATLQLFPDDTHGLKVRADLSKSDAARAMYEDIASGLVTSMSWAFTVDRQDWEEDSANRTETRTISHIKKIFDVSAVSIPANDATEISARSLSDGVIEEARRESARRKSEERSRMALLLQML